MRFSRSDVLFTGIILALVSVLVVLFVRDINLVLGGSGAEEIGTIAFKKRSATRRRASSYRWERLRSETKVFQGDTIRTADLSGVTIVFDDETELEVFENTLMTFLVVDGVSQFDFRQGTMTIRGGESGSGATRVIRSGDSVIELGSGVSASFTQTGSTVSVDVSAGQATVTDRTGAITVIGENREARLDSETGEIKVVEWSVVAVEPAQNERLVWQGVGKSPVTFVVSVSGDDAASAAEDDSESETSDRECSIEISRSRDFAVVEARVSAALPARSPTSVPVSIPLDDGVWYWRASLGEKRSPVRRFSVLAAAPVELIAPPGLAAVTFREEKPSVRFSWTQSGPAEAYSLELSRTADFSSDVRRTRTDMTGVTVAGLDEGTWHWRVSPLFSERVVGTIEPSKARSFSVGRAEKMGALTPVSPPDGAVVNLIEAREAGIPFSWKPEREAASYELSVLSARDAAGEPLFLKRVSGTWTTISLSEAAALSTEGTYYWTVRWIDAEGETSPAFDPERFAVADIRHTLSATFPPDGYLVEESLARSVRFAWKGTASKRAVLEVARDESFSAIAAEIPSSSFTALGSLSGRGAYFWRVRTFADDGSLLLETRPRRLEVVSPFAAPKLLSPGPTLTILDGDTARFSWESIEGADHYRLTVFTDAGVSDDGNESASSKGTRTVFNDDSVNGTSAVVPLGAFPEGDYRVVTQAFSADGPLSTRNIGYRAETVVSVKKLRPVTLVTPANGARLSGIGAKRNGVTLSWSMPDEPASLSVRLLRNGTPYHVPFAWEKGVTTLKVPSLPEGSYTWTVRASIGEFDVSSRLARTFVVPPIPLLSPPRDATPGDGAVIGPAELRQARELRFAWLPVEGANRYSFRVFSGTARTVVFELADSVATEAVISDLSVFDRGRYVWQVSGYRVDERGDPIQEGTPLSRDFTIDLPEIAVPLQLKDVEYYGK